MGDQGFLRFDQALGQERYGEECTHGIGGSHEGMDDGMAPAQAQVDAAELAGGVGDRLVGLAVVVEKTGRRGQTGTVALEKRCPHAQVSLADAPAQDVRDRRMFEEGVDLAKQGALLGVEFLLGHAERARCQQGGIDDTAIDQVADGVRVVADGVEVDDVGTEAALKIAS